MMSSWFTRLCFVCLLIFKLTTCRCILSASVFALKVCYLKYFWLFLEALQETGYCNWESSSLDYIVCKHNCIRAVYKIVLLFVSALILNYENCIYLHTMIKMLAPYFDSNATSIIWLLTQKRFVFIVDQRCRKQNNKLTYSR